MRIRTGWIIGLVGIFGLLCACVAVGGGLLAYRLLPTLLRPTPTPTLPLPATRPAGSPTPAARPTEPATPIPSTPPPTTTPLSPAAPALSLWITVPVEAASAMAPAPDGRLALFAANGQGGFLDPRTGEITEVPSSPEPVEELVFSPDGRVFALRTSSDILVWDLQREQALFTLTPEETVRRIAFSPQGTLLLVGGEETLSGYFVETGRRAFSFDLYGPADGFVMTPDERLIFQMSHMEGDLEVWDTHSGSWWGSISFEPLTAIALSPDGRLLAVAENEMRPTESHGDAPFPTRLGLREISVRPTRGKVELNLARELDVVPELEGRGLPLSLKALAFTPDGRRIVGLADGVGKEATNGRLYVWEAESGRMIGRAVLPPRPWAMAVLEEGRAVAVLIGDNFAGKEIRIYEIPGR